MCSLSRQGTCRGHGEFHVCETVERNGGEGRTMELIEKAYSGLLTAAVIILAVLVICSIIRSVLGPRIADRIIAVNMAGTMIISVIAVLSVYLNESYLADVCLIYAMISFLGVIVLIKVYTGVYLQKKNKKQIWMQLQTI